MARKNALSIIFHILLTFGVFHSFSVILGRQLGRWIPSLSGWITDLAAFLIAFTVSMFLARSLAPEETGSVPLPQAGVGSSLAYIGLGLPTLVIAMVLVLVVFPVSGDPVPASLLSRFLTAVCIHPLLEEILFRRVFLCRLLALSEPEPAPELLPAEGDLPVRPPVGRNRPGVLFALLTQAILFGLVHLGSGGMLYGFAGGVILGFLMLRTGRLWVPVLCHMLLNLRSLLWPVLSGTLTLALDVILFAVGIFCAVLLWYTQSRVRKRRRQERTEANS